MNTKLLTNFPITLLIVIFMQVAIAKANEEHQIYLLAVPESIVIDSVPDDVISLSQLKKMNNRELDNLFKHNAKEMLPKYRLGRTFSLIGTIQMPVGVLIVGAGIFLITTNEHYITGGGGQYFPTFKIITLEYLGGIILSSLGGAVTIMGATFTIVGFSMKNKCYKNYIYKQLHSQNLYQSTLKVGCTKSGLGVTFNF